MNEIENAIDDLDDLKNCESISSSHFKEVHGKNLDLAISSLENQLKLKELGFTDEVIENYRKFEDECIAKGFTFKSLIEAREKQIPKKVAEMKISLQSHSSIIKSIYGKCPICNTVQADDNYCQYCGQKLDWSVEE